MRRLFFVALLSLAACNGISQSPQCAAYLACTEAVMAGSSANYPSYAEAGACWSTDQKSADLCTAACVQGRQYLAFGAGAGKAECQ
ncbi:MAG: hypothetical protein IPJ65_25370 [Archangiaceae bacterium]|nr:hypothetical protein [Archangiaceae bacterium]